MIIHLHFFLDDCLYQSYTFYWPEMLVWVQEHGLWGEEA